MVTYRCCNLVNLPIRSGISPDKRQFLKDLQNKLRKFSDKFYIRIFNFKGTSYLFYTVWPDLFVSPGIQEKNLSC